ncbi:bifunctional folylpolyglutamate synthase/dihydrofolate synthase [Natribacillus halophilus]|uniref:Dihydrofolate synthase/folylpolyglutamate synthase n=1 Tax=Natribacillus halophilus TaxID=549003 RepID=A0A1G8LRV9_9BACI|nr:folylpolyglutamate synthase/dihydrofolate synthase family protein [Natribacillus halophilus]SDI58439.1 dihydrofolate synthase / folylpolyglutamate synthase [Natribacillus halophilus]
METYADVMTWLQAHRTFGIKPGLKRVEYLLAALENPERRLLSIHIAGTNGKGSTLAYVRAILQESGLEVGTFTSPYIVQFEERVSVNGTPIHREDFVSAARVVAPHARALADTEWGPPTEFELLTVIAMWHFAKVAVPDIVIWEVGLGGRLDATNVIQPILTAMTNIGMDHMHILGSDLQAIAGEKAGIMKPAVPVITASQKSEAAEVIRVHAREKRAPYYALDDHFEITAGQIAEDGGTLSVRTPFHHYHDLYVSLRGQHQLENGAVAVMIADYLRVYRSFPIDEASVQNGLAQAYWPGRLEMLHTTPPVLVDGAHNPEGIARLARFLEEMYADKDIHILTAVTEEKDSAVMFEPLLALQPKSFAISTFAHPRAADPNHSPLNAEIFMDWKEGYDELLRRVNVTGIIVITGSLFFISEVRAHLL